MNMRGSRRWPFALAAGGAVACLLLLPGLAPGLLQIGTVDTHTMRTVLSALGPLAPLASVALNVVQAVLAPVPAAALVYLNGAVFGLWAGALLNLV